MRLIIKNPYVVIFSVFMITPQASWASPEAEAFWSTCQQHIATPPSDRSYRVRHLGDNAAMAELLLNLILSGEKTVTFTSPWLFEGDQNLTPVAGGYTVLTDFEGRPGALLRTTSVKTLPFNEVTEADTQYEGPGARPLEAWRRIHWDFFTRVLELKGKAPTEDMPVTVEQFEVVCAGTT